MSIPSFAPRCPNHNAPLEGLPFPLPTKGTGMCPVSGCSFDYEVDVDDTKMVKDKFGGKTKQKTWCVTGDEK